MAKHRRTATIGGHETITRRLKLFALLAVVTLFAACATTTGSMMGRGIARATGGDQSMGALIGGGIGIMSDGMD